MKYDEDEDYSDELSGSVYMQKAPCISSSSDSDLPRGNATRRDHPFQHEGSFCNLGFTAEGKFRVVERPEVHEAYSINLISISSSCSEAENIAASVDLVATSNKSEERVRRYPSEVLVVQGGNSGGIASRLVKRLVLFKQQMSLVAKKNFSPTLMQDVDNHITSISVDETRNSNVVVFQTTTESSWPCYLSDENNQCDCRQVLCVLSASADRLERNKPRIQTCQERALECLDGHATTLSNGTCKGEIRTFHCCMICGEGFLDPMTYEICDGVRFREELGKSYVQILDEQEGKVIIQGKRRKPRPDFLVMFPNRPKHCVWRPKHFYIGNPNYISSQPPVRKTKKKTKLTKSTTRSEMSEITKEEMVRPSQVRFEDKKEICEDTRSSTSVGSETSSEAAPMQGLPAEFIIPGKGGWPCSPFELPEGALICCPYKAVKAGTADKSTSPYSTKKPSIEQRPEIDEPDSEAVCPCENNEEQKDNVRVVNERYEKRYGQNEKGGNDKRLSPKYTAHIGRVNIATTGTYPYEDANRYSFVKNRSSHETVSSTSSGLTTPSSTATLISTSSSKVSYLNVRMGRSFLRRGSDIGSSVSRISRYSRRVSVTSISSSTRSIHCTRNSVAVSSYLRFAKRSSERHVGLVPSKSR